MPDDREERFRGGRRSSRDRQFGIEDRDFWHWWHRVGKGEAGGADLARRDDAEAAHGAWIDMGRPKAR